jgi:DNA-binding transcriptional ArsR family regulator
VVDVPPRRSTDHPLVAVFQALSDATRLAVVERLSIGPASATELARPFDMALPSFMQHLGVLERAGVTMSHKTGRTRVYQLAPEALQLASAWLLEFRNHWERRLDQLDQLLLASNPPTTTPDQNLEPTS